MRVLFCWSTISGYMASCWNALAHEPDVELFVIAKRAGGVISAFNEQMMEGIDATLFDQDHPLERKELTKLVRERRPDVVVLSGWVHPAMRALVRHPNLRSTRFVMAMDNPWLGTWRQRLGRYRHASYFSRIDRVFVTGERCYRFARALGFDEAQIHRGVYGVDVDSWSPVFDDRCAHSDGWPRRFVTTGQYIERKGIPTLLEAHAQYAGQVEQPWPLTCCGAGPLAGAIEQASHVENRGFVQPSEMPGVLAEHGVFVLASHYDPWPLAIVEACAAGLPIVCTEACGSHIELVRPLHNGLTAPTGDAARLAQALRWMHDHYDRLQEMGRASRELARGYSARVWVDRWVKVFRELI